MKSEARPRSARFRVVGLRTSLCFLAFLIGCGAAAAKTLRFGYILSPSSQLGEGEKVFAAEIAARTGGRYTVENYPNAMLGGEVAMLKDVALGALDLAFITGASLPNLLPEVGVFDMPFLFGDTAEARAVLDGPIGDEYLKRFSKIGVVALAWGENGVRHITNGKRPIRRPEDLTGLKLRVPQSEVMAVGLTALGAEVRQMPFPEVYGSLQSGSVDGEENPIATIVSARFYEVQTYLTLTAHVYDPAVVVMSSDAFETLSAADKIAFRDAARVGAQTSRRVASSAEKTGIAILRERGMSIIETVDRRAFAERVSTAEPLFERQFGRIEIERIRKAAAAAKQRGGANDDQAKQ